MYSLNLYIFKREVRISIYHKFDGRHLAETLEQVKECLVRTYPYYDLGPMWKSKGIYRIVLDFVFSEFKHLPLKCCLSGAFKTTESALYSMTMQIVNDYRVTLVLV